MNTIPCPLYENAQNHGELAAIICDKRTITYLEFNQAVCATSKHLLDLGVREGKRIAIYSPNSVNYLIVLVSLWRIGAIACLLSTRLSEQQISKQLDDIDCSYLICRENSFLKAQNISFTKYNLNELVDDSSFNAKTKLDKRFQYKQNQELTILYTSGSENKPKAAMHTFSNHYFSAKGANEHIEVKPNDRWLLSLPLYHVGGFSVLFRTLLGKGIIVIPEIKQELSCDIDQYKISHISMVATQLQRLLKSIEITAKNDLGNFRQLKAILLGGSAIPESLIRQSTYLKLPVYLSYGLTEMSSQVATSRMVSSENSKRGAKLLSYRQVRISDTNEILVRGETLFKGYIQANHIQQDFDNEGWFHTGDLGSLTDNEYLEVFGRKDNMFICGGENIQPEEIENYLCQIQQIDHAVVVPIADAQFNLRPVAFIKQSDDNSLDKEDIISYLKAHLPKFKIPDTFYPWPDSGEEGKIKIDRMRFAQLAEEYNTLKQ